MLVFEVEKFKSRKIRYFENTFLRDYAPADLKEYEEVVSSFNDSYAFLSNFYYSQIKYEGHTFMTLEHCFQAQKAVTDQDKRVIMSAPTPEKARKLGNDMKLREDWEEVRLKILTECIRIKFEPDSTLADKLIGTGSKLLVDGNYSHEMFYGSCLCDDHKNQPGQNILGKSLMRWRNRLNKLMTRVTFSDDVAYIP